MYHTLSILLRSLVILLLVLITACATHQPAEETVRICNSEGCFDQPKGYVAPDSPTTKTVEKNPQIAVLEKLALQNPNAAYDLALRYFRADGVRQDSYQAIKWMRDAAERGNLKAQMALGRLYLTGIEEMGADPGEAQKWLSITSSKGDKEAADLLKSDQSSQSLLVGCSTVIPGGYSTEVSGAAGGAASVDANKTLERLRKNTRHTCS